MNVTQRGCLTLLKAAITQQPLALPEGFSLEEAYGLIRHHHMIPLAYEGAILCGIPRNTAMMQKLFSGYGKSLMISEGQMAQFRRICNAFDENGIDYMPLKGCNMKQYYPKPELRNMGDADILIRREQYEKIIPIMESLGFQAKQETDHELPWQRPELFVELHKWLIPSYNKDFYGYFDDGWKLAKVSRGTRYDMSPEDELIYLFTHFAKHYRDGGVGCRHVLDLWVFLRCKPDLDQASVEAGLKELKLLEFYRNVCRLMEVWFEGAEPDVKTDYISEFIFASGSWGRGDSRVLSRAVRDSKHSAFSGRVIYIWQTLFPSRSILEEKYTVLQKAPWLLPVVWLIRPFYKILFERKSLKKQEQNLDALSQEKLEERRRMLNYVGLDYNF